MEKILQKIGQEKRTSYYITKRPQHYYQVKLIVYTKKDKIEFKTQIKELLSLKLIRQSNSPYNSPAFMVRNHAKIKRKKLVW